MNLTDSKILLSNYPRLQQSLPFTEVGGKNKIDILCGYDIHVDSHQVTLQIANDLITAILSFDNIFIEGAHIWDVYQVFGSEFLDELLREGILHFIPDNLLNPVMKRDSDMIWKPDFFPYPCALANKSGELVFTATQEEWGKIETTLFRNGIKGIETQAFLYLVDDKKVDINQEKVKELALKETINDLNNKQFATSNDILRLNEQGLTEFHKLNILRLHELNTIAVTSGLLETDALKTDGQISNLMSIKCASVFSNKVKDGVSSIQTVLRKKGFPDLGELFVSGVIELDDVLKLRNSIQGKLFRYWIMDSDYDETQIQMDIMNSVRSVLGSKVSGAFRYVVCNALGLFRPVVGVAVSALDSFLLNKIMCGWHPNFFLDNVLKKRIDTCIEEKKEEEESALLLERFKGVGRNDPCPCGSGLKFKNCHGK